MKAVIALGANLGEPGAQVTRAVEEIRKLLNVIKVSSFYETVPFGVPDSQPNYINAVLIGETEEKPLDLMKALLGVENSLGRTRSFQNAARLIDIDIIDLGGLFMESGSLTLPHPRAHQRRFVLEPWLEIDPSAHLPGRGPISELLAALTQESRIGEPGTPSGLELEMKVEQSLTALDRPCALVPTMGALHAGHQSLIKIAREYCDEVVVSVFVNPLQFEDKDDLAKYPKTPEIDELLASQAGATVLWRPEVGDLYPGDETKLSAGELGRGFEGASRAGHFDGVLTVVNRLFELVKPKYAIFGEKDFQQLFLIKRMAAQLHPEIEIIAAPTIREENGLALSSRNVRLSQEGVVTAQSISRALRAASRRDSLAEMKVELSKLESEPEFKLDYAEIIDEESFELATENTVRPRALIAGWVDGVRLIDNAAMSRSLVKL